MLEVKAALEKVFPRVEVHHQGVPLVEPLDEASDQVLRSITVKAWGTGQWPAYELHVGRENQAYIGLGLIFDRVTDLSEDEILRMIESARQSAEIITHDGRRTLSQRHCRNLNALLVAVHYHALDVMVGVSIWPHVLWTVVAALALIPTAVLAHKRMDRIAARLGDGRHDRVIVQHLTRDEWRRRRFESRKDWKARGVGLLVGVVGTLLTALVVDVLKRQ